MDSKVTTWIYILITISFVYWFITGGVYLFPNVNPIIVSFIAMMVLYYVSNQRSLVLLV